MQQTKPESEGVSLESGVEKHLIRPGGSHRYVHCHIRVMPGATPAARLPLALALVIDRSGSMTGQKLATAKEAARAVVAQLRETDLVSVVVFDHEVDVLQPAAPVSQALKERLERALGGLAARGNTALYQGWLTGCHAIAGEAARPETLARCLLLTDGLANVGQTDPEQIATEAAGIREHAHVGTSTFGIGEDYDELLLGPLAVGGGGQFHHLREPREILSAFSGELGELFAVAARDVRLEVACASGIELEVISDYWTRREEHDGPRWSIAVGDLIAGDERHLVLRLGFPPRLARVEPVVRVRLVWTAGGAERRTPWSAFDFRYADDAACSAEPRDEEVTRWAARQQADRALKEATVQSRRGNTAAAQAVLSQARQRVAPQAAGDAELRESLAEMDAMGQAVASAPLASAAAKETLSRAQRRLRGQRDLRDS